ncbi:unnamed protein product [Sphenostylis stenocarpa]|uniref:UspA domain-containing protein n=1 Tax=Sphenostylis stenocarpa TaxID=92480 RepID=A0AA86SSA6_9FABA|nr:unnamed protein product [Sphenostylis stenocarpa]
MSSGGNLGCVLVSVDGSEESMKALRWALNNLKLRSPTPDSTEAPSSFIIFHVQSPPSIAAGLNPGAIPFGGPSEIEVPAFTAAIEAHQQRITRAVLDHALQICSQFNLSSKVRTHVVVGDPKEKICEAVQDLHADVLVMGSRAFGPIKRMFLGKELMHFYYAITTLDHFRVWLGNVSLSAMANSSPGTTDMNGGKLGYLNGEVIAPAVNDPKYRQGHSENSVVTAWLINSMYQVIDLSPGKMIGGVKQDHDLIGINTSLIGVNSIREYFSTAIIVELCCLCLVVVPMLARSCYKYVLSLSVDNAAVRVKFLQLRVLYNCAVTTCCPQCLTEIFDSRRFAFVLNLYNVVHKYCITIGPLSESVLVVIYHKLAIHHVQIFKLRVQLVLAATCVSFSCIINTLSSLINIYMIYDRNL